MSFLLLTKRLSHLLEGNCILGPIIKKDSKSLVNNQRQVKCAFSKASIMSNRIIDLLQLLIVYCHYTQRGRYSMKLSCSQENLNWGLSIVGRAVATRSTLPITQNILLSAEQS